MFDASSILILTRELGEKVVDVVKENWTASLAYYEVGNALWKECGLAKRLSVDAAVKVLEFMFSLLNLMKVVDVRAVDLGVKTLSEASKLNITYYDAAYLMVARELEKVLVTDDEKLVAASQKIIVKTLGSKTFMRKQ